MSCSQALTASRYRTWAFVATRLRVLIVDDNTETLSLFAFALTQMGCDVVTAESGAEGLLLASGVPLDVVVTDLAMPDMDGCQLVKRFRQIPAFAPTKNRGDYRPCRRRT